ncbi:MAG: glycosyltransferase [Bacteroidota bacterium]|jgi:peptidoglycan/xylan/chitin deacetylase (PgdA/CDA1 family)/glycosyltransferase involved in cell wall biosynthesis
MNILHVLSQFEVNGAETFAATLANEQIKNGHSVFIISDTFQSETDAKVFLHPIGKRDIPQRFANISFLKQFIRSHDIHLVDAHSRAASWVSYFATRKGNIPLVSHIHAQQHIHFSSKHFPIYGEKLVAVCKTIYTHLNKDLQYSLDKLALVKNGIDLARWNIQPGRKISAKKIVAYVGRLSGFKGDTLLKLIEETFPLIVAQYPEAEIHIIGGMSEQSKILPTIERTNAKAGKQFIIPKGFSFSVQDIYHTADVVVGSGRVAMEALASGARVVAVGESNYVGVLSQKTRTHAVETNFGDLDKRQSIKTAAAAKDIIAVLASNDQPDGWGRKFIEEEFNIQNVAPALDRVYAEASAVKKGIVEIPVLSYHAVVSEHEEGMRIHRDEFARQMEFLRKKMFTPISFLDLDRIAKFNAAIPAKPIVLTFQGNEENFHNAFPLLQQNGFAGVFFVHPQGAGEGSSLSVSQMNELTQHSIEIGSGGLSGRKFSLLQDDEIQREVFESRSLLAKLCGSEPISFAYPHGFLNQTIKQKVREAGYRFAVSIDDGGMNFWSDLLKIRRIQIFSGAPAFSFWKKTSGIYHRYKHVY